MNEGFKTQVKAREKTVYGQRLAFTERGKQMRGSVRIIVEEGGKRFTHFEDHNLIVNGGKKAMAHVLAEGDSQYTIGELRLDTGGDSGGDHLTPVSPIVTDSSLLDSADQVSVTLTSFEYTPASPNETGVIFRFTIAKDVGNGGGTAYYTEAGLFTVNGTMFARETFPALVKTAQRLIVIEWTISF